MVFVGLSQVPYARWLQTFSLKQASHIPLLVVALPDVKMASNRALLGSRYGPGIVRKEVLKHSFGGPKNFQVSSVYCRAP